MKTYDFSKGVRGAVLPAQPGKKRITDILECSRREMERAGLPAGVA